MPMTLEGSLKAYREKAFFTEPYIFRRGSCEWKLTLNWGEGGTLGSKNNWGEPLVGGDEK